MWSARWALGRAMFTMDESRMTMSWARPMTPSAIHRLGSGSGSVCPDVRSLRSASIVAPSDELIRENADSSVTTYDSPGLHQSLHSNDGDAMPWFTSANRTVCGEFVTVNVLESMLSDNRRLCLQICCGIAGNEAASCLRELMPSLV